MTQYTGALSWDSEISQESSFILLEPGEYEFTVTNMERSTYQPSPTAKIRENCPMAMLTLSISTPQGDATVFENLILHTSLEWKISEFFTSIGQKQPGVPFIPDWGKLIGQTGKAEIEVNKYTNKEGQERENNRVKRFLPKETKQTLQGKPQTAVENQEQQGQFQFPF